MPIMTPHIEGSVVEFARSINRDGVIEFLKFIEIGNAVVARCNENVTRLVDTCGGQAVSGWTIWSDSGHPQSHYS